MSKAEPHQHAVGADVGARRWPFSSAHPDVWQPPHKGTVLARNDPRAWTGTIAFSGVPSQSEVDEHIERTLPLLERMGVSFGVPVLWSFGQVFFEDPEHLVPYSLDCANWTTARAAERARVRERVVVPELAQETMGSFKS